MNDIQRLSQRIETDRLKLQMGLSLEIDVDALTLRAMWHQLCREREQSGLHFHPEAAFFPG